LKSQNIPLGYSGQIAMTAPNYTAQCVAAQQANVSGFALFDNGTTVVRAAADCLRQNYEPVYLVEGQGFTNIYMTEPGIKDNLWSEMPAVPYTCVAATLNNGQATCQNGASSS
jgi:branched-chain amino acid transport system substrate-binding protein